MFDHLESVIGLSEEYLVWESLSGESHDAEAEERFVLEESLRLLSDPVDIAERHLLPDTFDSIPPGPYLAAIVASIDRTRLNGHDLIQLMQAQARLAASYEAHKLATVGEVAYSPPGDSSSPVERSTQEIEFVADEVAAALTLTRRSAERELDHALSLRHRLSRVWDRFATGHIGFRKVREFLRELSHHRQEIVDQVLDRALDDAESLTTGQLRARINRELMIADPDGAESAFEEGLGDRRMTSYPNPDFTGNLGFHNVDPVRIAEATAHIDHIARSLKTEAEDRTLDQLRVDVALDLLAGRCARHPHVNVRRGGSVHLIVPLETLARLAHHPGELGGYGPVIAEISRRTALEAVGGEWTFSITDPDGEVVGTGTLARRPAEAQKRRARADYPTCVFPGCRMGAHECDLDHRKPFSNGGPTHNDNLGPLCRHHHMTRHHAPWLLERLPSGDHQWTSPLGHTYVRSRGPPR